MIPTQNNTSVIQVISIPTPNQNTPNQIDQNSSKPTDPNTTKNTNQTDQHTANQTIQNTSQIKLITDETDHQKQPQYQIPQAETPLERQEISQ